MIQRPLLTRRTAGLAARAGAVGSGLMLLLTVLALSPAGVDRAGAVGTLVGPAALITPDDGSPGGGQPLASGNSETPFSLFLGTGPTCPGDSANDGYNVTSFMVPSATDLTALQFDPAQGPTPNDLGTYATFRQPLYQVDGSSPYVGAQTANATTPPGPGPVVNIPAFNLAPAGIAPGNIPAGSYKIGVACIKGGPSATQLSNFWAAEIAVVTAASGGGAAGITWTAVAGPGTTTTTSTVGGGSSTTSTTASGGTTTTTTVGGGSTTSTTAGGASTTSTTAGTTTTTAVGGPTGGVSGAGGSLPTTGSSPGAIVVWAIFLIVCGRIAVVLGRPPKAGAHRP